MAAAAGPPPSETRVPLVPFPAKIPVRADTDPVESPDDVPDDVPAGRDKTAHTDRDLPVVPSQPAQAPAPVLTLFPKTPGRAITATPIPERVAPPVVPAPAPVATPAQPPKSTAPTSLPPPSEPQSTTSGPSPACPQCEAPMAWVEAHLRFYCKSCKMYF